MKHRKFAIAAAALVTLSAPAVAQLVGGYAGTEFVEAVRKSDGDKVTQLLRDHPTGLVDARDGDGNTALIIAIARRDEDWTGFLLNQNADPNLGGQRGDTPLITASRVGFDQAVEWLLGMGAKVDGANRMGETPLIVAVQQRQAPIVRRLLAAGANPDKTDTAAGYSARDYAQRDTRARDILKLIEEKKPKTGAAH
ncbi:MAG: ankyrin repeat domain-containing protein [Sphingomicrobium sp.]